MKTYVIELSNAIRVEVEAKTEASARKKVLDRIAENYDYPWEEADDYDGWSITSVDERYY